MFMLTKKEDDLESGAYATHDSDGRTVIQFFVDKDDAMSYNIQLEAVGYKLHVTETPDESIDKLCNLLGFAYTIVRPGEIIVPRTETLFSELGL